MFRRRKHWNINYFNDVNLPEMVGQVNPDVFSQFNSIRMLDMPIHMPGQGWKIPTTLSQFYQTIGLAIRAESQYGSFEDDHYGYITVDQKVVEKGKTGRRAGAHSDAYIETKGEQIDLTLDTAPIICQEEGEISHTYIIYDKFPTEFFNVSFPLTDVSCEGSLKTFDEIADASDSITYPAYTLLRLDPYVVHRCSIVPETSERTFVKISFSKKKYARKGNTINPHFTYDWQMSARSPHERNHPWS